MSLFPSERPAMDGRAGSELSSKHIAMDGGKSFHSKLA